MTFKMICIDRCRLIAKQRDEARTLENRSYQEWLLDAAVQDLISVTKDYRHRAKARLKKMRKDHYDHGHRG